MIGEDPYTLGLFDTAGQSSYPILELSDAYVAFA